MLYSQIRKSSREVGLFLITLALSLSELKVVEGDWQLLPDQLHKFALHRRQDRAEFGTAFQHHALFADQRPDTLFAVQGRALFDAIFGAFGGAAEGSEDGGVAVETDRIIAPFSCSDHAAI